MNELAVVLGLTSWKPVLASLLLPPLPALLLIVIAVAMLRRQRWVGGIGLFVALAVLWLSTTSGIGDLLREHLLKPPPPLSAQRIEELRRQSAAGARVVVVVLGGGRRTLAVEYGSAGLTPLSAERLHYGVWLSKQTNALLMFSGGPGRTDDGGPAEADVAQRISERDYHRPLRWVENQSHDTHENAIFTLEVLREQKVATLIVVTQDWHMPRAMRDFERVAKSQADPPKLVAAPMGQVTLSNRPVMRWLPTPEGFDQVWNGLHEWIGRLSGA
jgi:uncharacterized SAM-binding protein YcdF (DUF218 family)